MPGRRLHHARGDAPAPTDIAATAVQLRRVGVLGPDLTISLQRTGIGLAIGLSIGIVTGVLNVFLRRGEYLFNGVAQILNTIALLAVPKTVDLTTISENIPPGGVDSSAVS